MTEHHGHEHAMLDCETVMQQLWDYLDEELTLERMAEMRTHLAICANCYPQYEFERAFLAALERARTTHANPAALRERVAAALRLEGLTGA